MEGGELEEVGPGAEGDAEPTWASRISAAIDIVKAGWQAAPLSDSAWAVIRAVCGEYHLQNE